MSASRRALKTLFSCTYESYIFCIVQWLCLVKTFTDSCSYCGWYSSGYEGSNQPSATKDTIEDCQAECQKDMNCTAFAFSTSASGSNCKLKFYVSATNTSDPNMVSGSKYCPGLTSLNLQNKSPKFFSNKQRSDGFG